jgi:hypothetical protein
LDAESPTASDGSKHEKSWGEEASETAILAERELHVVHRERVILKSISSDITQDKIKS